MKKLKKIIKNYFSKNSTVKPVAKNNISFPGGLLPITKSEDQDVFIVGFPKSGNTLMQHIVGHLFYGINENASRSMINLIAPDVYANKHYFRFNDLCFFKSHERPNPRYKKVIYVIRDGREALLSYYHMLKNMNKEVSLDDLYKGRTKIYGGLWHEHINEWEANPYNAEIIWVKYEDLKNDKMKVLKSLCDFLNISRTEQELDEVIKCTSFNHMKNLENRNDWQKMNNKASLSKGNFVRKGAINSYQTEVDEKLIKEFESLSNPTLSRYYN